MIILIMSIVICIKCNTPSIALCLNIIVCIHTLGISKKSEAHQNPLIMHQQCMIVIPRGWLLIVQRY